MSVLHRLRGMVQMVSDVVFDDDGNATCKGVSDDQEDDSYSPTVAYHFGFYSRPSKARGVILKADGQGNTSFLIGFRDKQYELSLSKGEVGIKNEFNASILLDKNGVVNLNGSDKGVARMDDTANCGWLVFTPNVPPGGAAVLAYLPPDTIPVPTVLLFPAPTVLLPLRGKIDSASAKVKSG